MLLKRIFTDGEATVQDCMASVAIKGKTERQFDHSAYLKAGGEIRVRIQNLSKKWHASPSVIEKGVAEGFIRLGNGQLTLRAPEGEADVMFDIIAPPNRDEGKHYYDCKVVN